MAPKPWNAANMSPSALVTTSSLRPPRSKLGCKTCNNTGRKCEYEGTTISPKPASPLSLSPNTVWRERRAFAYYFEEAAPSVGGDLDVDFWRTIVPQVCRSEPAVWDAINSISALFESPEPFPDIAFVRQGDHCTLNQNHRDAIGWYSRSVSAIRQRIERGDVDIFVGLVSCVLFICIEALQGGVEEALQLYGQGVHLIHTLRAQASAGVVSAAHAFLVEDTIVPIFIRLGAIAPTISSNPVRTLLLDTEETYEFVSLKSARDAMVLLGTEAQLFQRTCVKYIRKSHVSHVSPELEAQQIALSTRLRKWHTAFTDLMGSLGTKYVLSPQQIGTGALLVAYHETLLVLLATCVTSRSEILTDAYLPNFQTIIEQSRIALDASARSDGTQPPFTFDASVAGPLWFTCLRCRDPGFRRTALALLRRTPHVHGFYKNTHATTFIEKMVVVEKTLAVKAVQGTANSGTVESSNTPIPEEARLGPVTVFRARDGVFAILAEQARSG
ncbi:C6 zinc finger domain protein [Penicillium lagena]|uniref:C6 zinc finger domain protein n=1 Tax=Penicillium lagena TaxID=94218 RepID=UPI00254014F8|nr:C6 zinc finger domain protein [Penicillium lagena]KAJ5605956.1 C6 zinc finger domain protein [Penicillium lagena]